MHTDVATKKETGLTLFYFLAGHLCTPALFCTHTFSPQTVTFLQITTDFHTFLFWLVLRVTTFAPNRL